jgi:hypothetical protein
MHLRVGPLATALLLAAAMSGCSRAGLLGEYEAVRTLHLAPDRRLVVTDLDSGNDDGAVVAVDVASGRQTVLIQDLPSTRNSGQSHADLAGPSGAAMAADGTVCAAIGGATRQDPGFATLRCTNGLVVDIEAFQARSRLPSNPYDVVSDGGRGWYVSDGAANNVLHIDQEGRVAVVARFPSLAATALEDRDGQGVPTGLALGPDHTLYVALYGGASGRSAGTSGPRGRWPPAGSESRRRRPTWRKQGEGGGFSSPQSHRLAASTANACVFD